MPLLARFASLLRHFSRRQQEERDLDEEVSSCIDQLTQENMEAGMDPASARRAALLKLGGQEQIKEQVREVRTGVWLETLLQDIRYGLRMLANHAGFSALVVVTLALGIGANTAIFSVVYGVLLRPLPYADGGQLVVLHQQATHANLRDVPFSVKEVADYRNQSHTLADTVEYHSMAFLLLGENSAERVDTGVVSANFFDVLGVRPLLGRTFIPSDETVQADAVLVLSYQYWQRHCGGDPNIVGKVFQMNSRPHTVIGVLPPVPQYPDENDVYMTTAACPFRSSAAAIDHRDARLLTAFGRLKPGVALATAQADLSTVANQIATSYPEAYPAAYGYGIAAAPLQEELTRRARTTLLVLLGAAGFVLLIACANVANLQLSRLMKREREFAVRSALGASRKRLVRQLLTETVLLSLAGGVLGLMIASPTLALLVKFAERFTPRAAEVHIDWVVLTFTLSVSILSGLLFGLAPALSSGDHVSGVLKQNNAQTTSSRGRQRLRAGLVVLQIAVSFVLLIGAGLMMRSFFRLTRVDAGFSADRVLTFRVTPNFTHYSQNAQLSQLSDEMLRRVRAVGGVESAASATNFPFSKLAMTHGPGSVDFQIEDHPVSKEQMHPLVDLTFVSTGYFETIRQPIVEGRTFSDQDREQSLPVAIINRTMATHRWANEDPIGKRVSFDQGKQWLTIVGVIGDAKEYGLDHPPGDEIYTPVSQSPPFAASVVVRTSLAPESFFPMIRSTLRDLDPQLAIDQVQTLERLRDDSVASPRVTMMLLGIFAGLALVISASGIAGIMALSVSQRSHELGIRMALGQPTQSLVGMVVREGLIVALTGTALGLGGAIALGRMLSSLLYDTSASDMTTFVSVSIIFVLVAGMACLLPTWRVTLIDPFEALRQE
jgi:putative ABC transport system permease protein